MCEYLVLCFMSYYRAYKIRQVSICNDLAKLPALIEVVD